MYKEIFPLLTALAIAGSAPASAAPKPFDKSADGIIVPVNGAFLKVQVYADNVVRIACAKDRAFFDRKSVVTEPKRVVKSDWSVKNQNGEAVLTTAKLQVHVNLANGAVSFSDTGGKPILAETPGGRTITPAEVQGEPSFHVRQEWEPNADESLYGLGQRQIGVLNIKGYDLDLWQWWCLCSFPAAVTACFGTTFPTRASAICARSSLSRPIASWTLPASRAD